MLALLRWAGPGSGTTRWHRLARFWGTGVDRAALQVLYFGQVYADRDVPWHYPWLYFAATVPVGLQVLGAARPGPGLARPPGRPVPASAGRLDRLLSRPFSTKIPVYDGERLFLLVFPLWAMLIGRGFAAAWAWAGGGLRVRACAAAVDSWRSFWRRAYGVVALHPFGLSYYNLLVGGLPGAERLGLELTYWGDAVDRVLLDRLAAAAAPNASAALVPTLYPGQGIMTTTRGLFRRGIVLQDEAAARAPTGSSSRAGPPTGARSSATASPAAARFATRSRQGVWLSGVWSFTRTRADCEPDRPHRNFNLPLAIRATICKIRSERIERTLGRAGRWRSCRISTSAGRAGWWTSRRKAVTLRTARASGLVRMEPATLALIRDRRAGQGGRLRGRPAGRDHGGEADRRPDPALPSRWGSTRSS